MNPDTVRLVRDSSDRVTTMPHACTTLARQAAAWLSTTLLAAAAAPAQAAAVYAEHWDGGLSTQGWYANSGQAAVSPNAVVGQPPGSLASVYIGPDGFPGKMIGATSGNLELIGSYHGQTWQVSFDAMVAELAQLQATQIEQARGQRGVHPERTTHIRHRDRNGQALCFQPLHFSNNIIHIKSNMVNAFALLFNEFCDGTIGIGSF